MDDEIIISVLLKLLEHQIILKSTDNKKHI